MAHVWTNVVCAMLLTTNGPCMD